MSSYTFLESDHSVAADRKHRPALDKGQCVRTVAFWLSLAIALSFMAHRQSHASGHAIAATAVQIGVPR